MERTNVSSSNIKSVGYDKINEILEVEFHHGKVYHYKDVPANLAKDMIDASSVGKFFNANVKNAYKFEQGEFKETIITSNINIYICGPAGAGKTYTAKYLIEKFKFLGAKVAFPVYGIAYDYFHMYKKDRKLLQTIGTEGARDVVDSDIWVNRFIEDIKIVETTRKLLDLPKVGFVCDDCRFENEHKALKENGWIGLYLNVSNEIRLERLKKRDGDAQTGTLTHSSELDMVKFKDELIQMDASKSVEVMYAQVDKLLKELSLERNKVNG